ncbi:disease resistance protein L6-like [Telopea speciosissima]|uniref:disease resistance protein L6-like n=1 Tax=Telopea speciosissima TaxID=54955 RepID=UPI001CC5FDC8|nr:disease resistance protein L6-like [Telopea speciosissima]
MAALDGASSDFAAFTTGFSCYDVFLNFSGEDTRNNFTAFLNLVMKDRGIDVFIDSESKWCLLELAQIFQSYVSDHQLVLPIFFDVDPSDVRNQTGSFEEAFREHEKNFDPQIVESWKKALREIGSLKGEVIDKNKNQAEIVELVVKRVLDVLVSSTTLAECKYPIGIDSRVQCLLSLLSIDSNDVQFIGICGYSGIGKTTIVEAVYNRILSTFNRYSFILDVSKQAMQCMGLVSLQKRLLKDIFKIDSDIGHLGQGKNLIKH